jgi:uncharacterized protein YjiS (DUF1127 family)
MTNPAITQGAIAHHHLAADAPARWSLLQLLRNWNVRRKIKALQDYDDRILDDIGVNRFELEWAGQLPLSTNAALELETRAYNRRKAQRHMWL